VGTLSARTSDAGAKQQRRRGEAQRQHKEAQRKREEVQRQHDESARLLRAQQAEQAERIKRESAVLTMVVTFDDIRHILKIQTVYRKRVARREVGRRRAERNLMAVTFDDIRHILKIQTVYRKRVARRKVERRRAERIARESAMLKIQQAARKRETRRRHSESRAAHMTVAQRRNFLAAERSKEDTAEAADERIARESAMLKIQQLARKREADRRARQHSLDSKNVPLARQHSFVKAAELASEGGGDDAVGVSAKRQSQDEWGEARDLREHDLAFHEASSLGTANTPHQMRTDSAWTQEDEFDDDLPPEPTWWTAFFPPRVAIADKCGALAPRARARRRPLARSRLRSVWSVHRSPWFRSPRASMRTKQRRRHS
jgi:hypothetical protein